MSGSAKAGTTAERAHLRGAAFCMFGFARSSEARVRRSEFLLTSVFRVFRVFRDSHHNHEIDEKFF
jgi:hypothetical protein